MYEFAWTSIVREWTLNSCKSFYKFLVSWIQKKNYDLYNHHSINLRLSSYAKFFPKIFSLVSKALRKTGSVDPWWYWMKISGRTGVIEGSLSDTAACFRKRLRNVKSESVHFWPPKNRIHAVAGCENTGWALTREFNCQPCQREQDRRLSIPCQCLFLPVAATARFVYQSFASFLFLPLFLDDSKIYGPAKRHEEVNVAPKNVMEFSDSLHRWFITF